MSLATKQQMSRHPNITVLSQQDLERRFRKSYPWRPLPSPLSLVKLYVETEKPKNLMLDEVPLETSWCRELLTFAMRTVLSLGIQKSTALSLFFFAPVSLIFLIPFNFSSLSFLVWAFLWTVVLFLPWLHLGAKVSETVVFSGQFHRYRSFHYGFLPSCLNGARNFDTSHSSSSTCCLVDFWDSIAPTLSSFQDFKHPSCSSAPPTP